MRAPRFTTGDSVLFTHRGKRISGEVVGCINFNDQADARAQGYRYTIRTKDWMWALPEASLRELRRDVVNTSSCKAPIDVTGPRLHDRKPGDL